jgi:hypothetical protein
VVVVVVQVQRWFLLLRVRAVQVVVVRAVLVVTVLREQPTLVAAVEVVLKQVLLVVLAVQVS